jgi:hypothetical protein
LRGSGLASVAVQSSGRPLAAAPAIASSTFAVVSNDPGSARSDCTRERSNSSAVMGWALTISVISRLSSTRLSLVLSVCTGA